jgi:hypothetical protein
MGCEQRLEERPGDTRAAVTWSDSDVQYLQFIGRRTACDEKSHNFTVKIRNRNVISGRVPARRFGTGGLDGGDGSAVFLASSSDDHYFLGA